VDWDGTLAVWREVSCEETDCTVNLHDHADFLCLNETLPLVCLWLNSFAWIWLTFNKRRKHSPPPTRVHVYRANPSDTTATTSQTKQNMANLQVPVRGARGGAPVTKAVILVGNDRDNQYYMNTWLK
jgi:hypothetical protein